jgi:hypothetical protein
MLQCETFFSFIGLNQIWVPSSMFMSFGMSVRKKLCGSLAALMFLYYHLLLSYSEFILQLVFEDLASLFLRFLIELTQSENMSSVFRYKMQGQLATASLYVPSQFIPTSSSHLFLGKRKVDFIGKYESRSRGGELAVQPSWAVGIVKRWHRHSPEALSSSIN